MYTDFNHWPTFLSLHVWVYLHPNLCSGLQKTHLFCTRERFGRSRSFKVNDFGTNRKRVCAVIVTMVLRCTVSEIRRRDLLAKNCLFFLPHSHSALSLPMFPLEFCGEFSREETRVMGLSSSEDRIIVA